MPLFTVTNHHVEDCGEPPSVDGDDGQYHGYFVNQYGEQAVFTYDYATKRGILRMGDAGWAEEYEVKRGWRPRDLFLSEEEQWWLFACWRAAEPEESVDTEEGR